MNNIKIGDVVRFLDSVGGGIVKEFKDKNIVLVEDNNGFDIPTLISQCVVVSSSGKKDLSDEKILKNISNYNSNSIDVNKNIKIKETYSGEKITVALAFFPIDEKNISKTSYESFLVNDSNYFLSYNYFDVQDEVCNIRLRGIIEPNSNVFIENIDKEQLNEINNICLQFFAYKDKPYDFKPSYSIYRRIDTVKFYKLHSFQENDYFEDKALVYYLVEKDMLVKELQVSSSEIEESIKTKKIINSSQKKNNLIKDKLETIEIDLHIDQLIDNVSGLSLKDILDYQLSIFHNIMAEYKHSKNQKIVFIHGKGDGVLRSSILGELKNKYKCVYQDASFLEYGFGATMVTIR